MYATEGLRAVLKSRRGATTGRVSRTVVLLGVTSMLTDISAEMVATVLPIYLFYSLGLSPLQFGAVDGAYQGAAAVVRVVGGMLSDRTRRHKEVAAAGYGISALCKPALLLAGSAWGAIVAVILLDRAGKGIRTAPRDALISLSTEPADLGSAFGVHRALDTLGAMLGPLLAFGLLLLTPGAFDVIFVVSFCIALLGLGVLLFFVQNPPAPVSVPHGEQVSLRSAAALLAAPRFRWLVITSALLGLTTISDAFVYLSLQRRLDFSIGFVPLLYVGTALVFMLLAVPLGRLSDRIGRLPVFLGGYGLLTLVYVSLLLPGGGSFGLVAYLVAFGAYYAATDGVLMAMGASLLPAHLRATGLAVLGTASGLSRLLASVAFGALWSLVGIKIAVVTFGVGLLCAMLLGGVAMTRLQVVAPT